MANDYSDTVMFTVVDFFQLANKFIYYYLDEGSVRMNNDHEKANVDLQQNREKIVKLSKDLSESTLLFKESVREYDITWKPVLHRSSESISKPKKNVPPSPSKEMPLSISRLSNSMQTLVSRMGELNKITLKILALVKQISVSCPNSPESKSVSILLRPSFVSSPPNIEEILEQFALSRHLVVQSLTYLGNYLRANREVLKNIQEQEKEKQPSPLPPSLSLSLSQPPSSPSPSHQPSSQSPSLPPQEQSQQDKETASLSISSPIFIQKSPGKSRNNTKVTNGPILAESRAHSKEQVSDQCSFAPITSLSASTPCPISSTVSNPPSSSSPPPPICETTSTSTEISTSLSSKGSRSKLTSEKRDSRIVIFPEELVQDLPCVLEELILEAEQIAKHHKQLKSQQQQPSEEAKNGSPARRRLLMMSQPDNKAMGSKKKGKDKKKDKEAQPSDNKERTSNPSPITNHHVIARDEIVPCSGANSPWTELEKRLVFLENEEREAMARKDQERAERARAEAEVLQRRLTLVKNRAEQKRNELSGAIAELLAQHDRALADGSFDEANNCKRRINHLEKLLQQSGATPQTTPNS